MACQGARCGQKTPANSFSVLYMCGVIFDCLFSSVTDKSSKICGQLHSVVTPLHVSHEPTSSSNNLNGHLPVQNHCNRPNSANMATSFPNMNITNPIRGLVSKKRNRYKQDGFNLDLTCILFFYNTSYIIMEKVRKFFFVSIRMSVVWWVARSVVSLMDKISINYTRLVFIV